MENRLDTKHNLHKKTIQYHNKSCIEELSAALQNQTTEQRKNKNSEWEKKTKILCWLHENVVQKERIMIKKFNVPKTINQFLATSLFPWAFRFMFHVLPE